VRILLVAEEAAGVQVLRMLAGTAHQVAAVVTRGAGMGAIGATVAGVATRLGYPVWPARRAQEPGFAQVITSDEMDILLNVQTQQILPADVVAAPRIGSFNLHPGPLPAYAGLNAPSWALYHGESTHGVTLHWMDAGIDTGPVAYSSSFPIEEDDNGLTLSAKCVRAGLPLIHDLLEDAARQTIPRTPQPQVVRRYYGREIPHQGRLVWTEMAARIVNFIRACDYAPFASPWGLPRAYLTGREIVVLKAALSGERSDAPAGTIGRREGSDMLVAARDQWIRVRRVQVGSTSYPAGDVLRPGERFALPIHREASAALQ
jgi:UDP-4-amino-4-deoxy-L-arabinose formyltransferase/UDP-glucuronic acid dehydrogenase (UDP-4-keto-hexauronic acid decarboxylating)